MINSAQNINFKSTGGSTVLDDVGDFLGLGSARREREFSEYMSSTAYQRAVADMKKAGLNPAMMYSSGSNMQASSGAHSAASVGQLGQIAGVVSSAAQFVNANSNKYAQKDNKKIASSAAKMIQTAQLLASALV